MFFYVTVFIRGHLPEIWASLKSLAVTSVMEKTVTQVLLLVSMYMTSKCHFHLAKFQLAQQIMRDLPHTSVHGGNAFVGC